MRTARELARCRVDGATAVAAVGEAERERGERGERGERREKERSDALAARAYRGTRERVAAAPGGGRAATAAARL